MNTLNVVLFILLVVGVSALVTIAIIMLSRTNHSLKGEYDERQQLMKGKAFRAAFFTGLGYSLLVFLLDIVGCKIPMETGLLGLTGGMISLVVYVTIAIMNDAYIGLNEKLGSTLGLFAVCGVMNIIPAITNIRSGGFVKNGVLTNSFANVIIFAMLFIISAVLVIKHCVMNRGEESDEES